MKSVLIIGAGPAGLASAYEILKNSKNFKVTIVEEESIIGGISRTEEYHGFRFDIGGHRFFTKNKEIEDLWKEVLNEDLLVRPRLSRWFYKQKFFNYPINPVEILKVFGPIESIKIMISYVYTKIFPRKEKSLEDFYINQFGRYLAKPFFLDFNKKLWGIPCDQLSMDFGKQRVKGVSAISVIIEYLKKILGVKDKKVVKSLIDEFFYPKYGPGMMWDKIRILIEKKGGKILKEHKVVKVIHKNWKIKEVVIKNKNKTKKLKTDYILSTMPLKEFVLSLEPRPQKEVIDAANFLKFRDFISVALILNKKDVFPDTWLYTHDPGMRTIRIQNFKNWSPWLVPNENQTGLGFEYVCSVGDDLWSKGDEEMVKQAISDLEKTKFANKENVIDSKVIRLRNVYPVYNLDYKEKVSIIKNYLGNFNKKIKNHIQPMGRGGMHRYNNQDHSMYTGILAARNLLGKNFDLWKVNEDAEYHEEKLDNEKSETKTK